jgi:hypothetical protein
MPPQPPEQAIRSPALIPKTQQITREVIVRQAAPIEEHRARPEHDVPIAEFPSRQDKPVVQQAAMAPPKALFEIKETVRLEPRPAAYPALPDFAAQPGRLAAPPTPRPVIHVTIGRIEVRAARQTAAPQPAERRSPSAAMSLDEYLRRRSEGGR